jgi:glycosyltransferase involved in cell wall biosynthesis
LVGLLSRSQLRSFAPAEALSAPTTVIYIGAFEPWHGITILIRAVAKALAQSLLIKLVLVGSGSQNDIAKQLVHDLGIEQHVIFTGHLSELDYADLLAQADIGVSPYCGRVEFSGLKLLDYKAAGLATIASGENGQPAVIEQGHTGLIVPPCDEEALCEAIIGLANNFDLRRKMGRQARLEAENRHSWKNTASQLQDSFYKVLNP